VQQLSLGLLLHVLPRYGRRSQTHIWYGNRRDRDLMPHRGDYLGQHPIDGRVDPGSCVRCHGNRNDGACIGSHKNHRSGNMDYIGKVKMKIEHTWSAKNIRGLFLLTAVSMVSMLFFGACSTANPYSPLALVDASGRHPDGWLEGHGAYALPDGSLCVDCHGEDLTGGISQVSCSSASYNGQSCHANGPAFHPDDWLDKSSADFHKYGYSSDPSACQFCHDVTQPDTPPVYNCLDCHFSEDGTRRVPAGSLYSHGSSTGHDSFTGADADVCISCHEVNNRFGYEPFCHNCHEIHPETNWAQRIVHGTAAKQSAGSMTGFSTCASCHGEDFDGGVSGVSCLSASDCHQVNAPHPSGGRWRGESTPTHTNTNPNNAPSCGLCHLDDREPPAYDPLPPGSNPGCTNNTLCHGNED
jgi:hypothetical protein